LDQDAAFAPVTFSCSVFYRLEFNVRLLLCLHQRWERTSARSWPARRPARAVALTASPIHGSVRRCLPLDRLAFLGP